MFSFFYYLTMAAFVFVCVFLMLLVLIQKGRGGGLSSAFGGAGSNTAFGSKTGDVLTWATSVVFGVFLLLAVAMNLLANAVGAPPAPAAKTAPVLPAPTGTTPTPTNAPLPAGGAAGAPITTPALPTTQP